MEAPFWNRVATLVPGEAVSPGVPGKGLSWKERMCSHLVSGEGEGKAKSTLSSLAG
jgi:hypothetical protein